MSKLLAIRHFLVVIGNAGTVGSHGLIDLGLRECRGPSTRELDENDEYFVGDGRCQRTVGLRRRHRQNRYIADLERAAVGCLRSCGDHLHTDSKRVRYHRQHERRRSAVAVANHQAVRTAALVEIVGMHHPERPLRLGCG
ncbi:MAG: hypothetical protein E6H68_11755 [Betaproteobacteria bacterium]|nr:MAG: hypothetical protein E6H68_11755 [Betaproteobacteria bacterium]